MLFLLLACSKDADHGDSIVDTPEYTCVDVSQVDGTSASGISYCSVDDVEFGYMDRHSAIACTGDPYATVSACMHGDEGGCAKDADCATGQVCGASTKGPYCECYTICSSDADCGADQACMCALQGIPFDRGGGEYVPSTIDQCLTASCRTGADCASGECGASRGHCGQGGAVVGFYCRTPADECRTNQDCPESYEMCAYDPELARWACQKGAICD